MVKHPVAIDVEAMAKIDASAVRFLWENDRWDIPLEGVAEYAGERCYFVSVDRMSPSWVLYRMSAEQVRYEDEWHALFVEHVGSHCDYVDGYRSGAVKPMAGHAIFYDRYKAEYRPHVFAKDAAVGVFSWTEST